MADKRVIILDKTGQAGVDFNVVLWAVVPTTRRTFYAAQQANFVSAWKDITATEAAKFTSGEWTERPLRYSRPDSGGLPQAQAELQAEWQKFQNEIDNFNPWNRYGSNWDGTAWSMVTVA
jgi:hypothetical protein